MELYDKNGYLRMDQIMQLPYPFIFVVHGRGTGKTYGACKYLLDNPELKWLLLRRTQVEAETVSFTDFSPFQPVINDNPDKYPPLAMAKIPGVKNITGAYRGYIDAETGKLKPEGDPLGYVGALATLSNIRGFNGEQIKIVVYDEFIPENKARAMKNEGDAVLNAYETISRNRELKGLPPLKMVFLANANKLASPVFQSMGIINKIDKMLMKDQQEMYLKDRGIAIIKPNDSPVSRKKKTTALYTAAQAGDFMEMALANAFDKTTYMYIGHEPIKEYRPVATYEDICIYRHKSEYRYYVSRHLSGSPKHHYVNEEMSRKKMKKELFTFFDSWLRGNVIFEDFYCKQMLIDSL